MRAAHDLCRIHPRVGKTRECDRGSLRSRHRESSRNDSRLRSRLHHVPTAFHPDVPNRGARRNTGTDCLLSQVWNTQRNKRLSCLAAFPDDGTPPVVGLGNGRRPSSAVSFSVSTEDTAPILGHSISTGHVLDPSGSWLRRREDPCNAWHLCPVLLRASFARLVGHPFRSGTNNVSRPPGRTLVAWLLRHAELNAWLATAWPTDSRR